MLGNEIKNEFIARRGLGESYRMISVKLNVSEKTLKRWGGQFASQIREAEEAGLKVAMDLHNLAKSGRLQAVAIELERLDVELGKRDLSAIPVSRLIMLKLSALELAGKIIGPELKESTDSRSPWDAMMAFLSSERSVDSDDKELDCLPL
jgi:hypothetical protein